MDANITIDKIITRKLKTLHPKDKLIRAKEIFDEYDIHHIPVHVMGDIRGIVSLGDILFCLVKLLLGVFILHGFLEALDGATQVAAEAAQFLRAENQQDDDQDDE